MVLIFTGNEQLDNDLSKIIDNSRVVYYSDYVLQENQAEILILAVQNNKFNFNDFIFKVREKNIRVILLLENSQQEELKYALQLGIYDVVFDSFSLNEITSKIETPNSFSKIANYFKNIFKYT